LQQSRNSNILREMKLNWQIKGGKLAKQILGQQLINNKLANFYLIIGPDGVGKKLLIKDFIKMLRCQDKGSKPCQACEGCLAVKNQSDTELIIIKPEEGKMLKIEQTRKLKSRLQMKTFGQRQIIWLQQAELLTTEAANSILKLLEDSTGENKAIFILSSKNLNLPITVVSRSQKLFLSPEEIELDSNTEQTEVEKTLSLTGLTALYERFTKDKKAHEKLDRLFRFYQQLKKRPIADKLEAVNKKLVDWPIAELLFYFLMYERKQLISRVNQGKKYQLHKENIEALLAADQQLSYRVNRKILLKNLLINLK